MKQHIHSLRLCQTLLVVALLGQAQMAHAYTSFGELGEDQCRGFLCLFEKPEASPPANANQTPQIQTTTTRLSQGFVHLRGEVIKQRQARAACNAASGANGPGCTPP